MNQVQNKHKHNRKHDHQASNKNAKNKKFGKKQFYRNKRVHADQHLDNDIRQILKRLRYLTNQIRSYVVHSSEEQLLWSVNLSSWNIKQIIGFIGIKDQFISELAYNVINTENLEFKRPDTESDMEQEEFNNRSLEYLIGIYNTQRKKIANTLYQSKTEHWDIEFSVDSESMNLKSYLNLQLDNDEKLLDMIFMNLQRNDPWLKEEKIKEQTDDLNRESIEKTDIAANDERNGKDEKEKESKVEKEKELGKEKNSEEKEEENRKKEESSKEKEQEGQKEKELSSSNNEQNDMASDAVISESDQNQTPEENDSSADISESNTIPKEADNLNESETVETNKEQINNKD